MPDITKGTTFTSGQTVTAALMNTLVDDAVINDNAITTDKLAANSVTSAKISSSAAIAYSKLAALSGGNLVVGDVNNVATSVALSGDATMSNTGSITIGDGAVTTAKVLDANITTAKLADSTGASDGGTAAKLATGAVTGPKIAMTSDAQGDILYRGASNYERLGAGSAGQVLESGGADANPSWVDSGPKGIETFESDGTFTVPAKVTSVKVTVVGGGGGGAEDSNTGTKMGGGAGGSAIKVITGLTPGADIAVVVGAGGAVNVAGGDSSFGESPSTVYCSATGGEEGSLSYEPVRGAGGAGAAGDTNFTGESGLGPALGGTGGGSIFGGGGRWRVDSSYGVEGNATTYGGGGAGGQSTVYGVGFDGVVIVEY